MKKTILALALSLIMIFTFAFSVNASNTTSFAVTSATADRGATVTLDVTVNSMPEVNSLGLQVVSYDKTVLELVSGTWNTANMNSPALAQPLNVSNGTAGSGWMAPTTFVGHIFSLTFKVKDNAAIGATSVIVKLLPKNNKVSAPLAEVQATATITVACSHANTENRIEVPATCNLPGTAAGVYCLGCNTYISGGTPILPTGKHADADGKWEISETEHWHTCSCGEILDKVAHSGGTATCVAKAQCSVCASAYGEINAANHKVSTQQIADDKYLVAGSGANCKEYKKYYYECVDCHAATSELWTSTVLGEHNYGTLVDAKPEVHTPDKLESAVAAHYLCSVCQIYFTDAKVATTIEALTGATPVHTFGAFKADAQNHWKECSCTKKDSEGKHIFDNDADMICDTCSYDRSCTHSKPLTHVEAKPAACTVAGNIEYWYCVDCQAKFDSATATNKLADVSVPAPGHIFDTNYTYADGYHWKACTGIGCTEKSENAACDSAVKATCQQKAVCDTCGNTYTDFAPHDYATEYTTDAGKHWRACKTANCVAVIDEANCSGGTATCYKLAECATCNKEYGALTAHVISTTWDYKDATGHAYACTNTGCTYHDATQAHVDDAAGEKCTVCGYVYHTCGVDMTYVPAVIGSCLVKGRQAYYICSCGKFYYDVAATKILNDLAEIEAYGGHISIVVPAVPATCTTNGSTEAMSCAVCRIQFVVAQIIPAKGHEWSEWTTTVAPTDFVAGTKARTCDICKSVETASIPALGHEHTVVELPAVAPTCSATGLTAGSKCATCEKILKAQEVVPVIDHSVEHVAANAATATETGNVEYWQCSECEVVWLDEARTTVASKEDTIIPVIPETEPEETTQAPEETTATPEETTAAPEETTEAPEETTAAPEETTEVPEDTTVAPEETTAAPEETTSPEVPDTGDNAIFFIVALIAISTIMVGIVSFSKKRED